MKKFLLCGVIAALGTGLLAQNAHALRNLSLRQQGDLPRDQYVDLLDPAHFYLDKLVVQFVEDTRIRLRDGRLASLEGRSTTQVEDFLKSHPEITIERLFLSMDENSLDQYVAEGERKSGWDVADLNNFYMFKVDGRNADPGRLLQDLLKLELVQTGYYEPIPEPATCGVDPAPVTPNYLASQDYREAAPTGIDINYAWSFDPTYGNGISSYWFQDLEWGWCETHEDYASLSIRNPPDSGVADFFNHGTAVVSIVGACDDGKGVTGEVPDVHLTTRVVSNHASTADALIAIGADLLTGETYLIEMHDQGPNPGGACVCNCAQWRYIAMEYWNANFNAILANSANGIYCIEAAGNGSMDLDNGIYGGAFDLGVRDSQAIVVGAGTSGAVHNPECWTNHGTRISAYGWGDSVYAAGYGDAVNPAGCDQDYTTSFSGTSSASPIVTGAAISLALIHRYQAGAYLSPTGLRSRLTINGTAQGPTDPWKELSVLPNMKGILAPDLAPYNPGWAAEIVPSDVTGTNVLPANLPPTPADTYFDFSWVNWSFYANVVSSPATLYRDDAVQFNAVAGNHGPYSYVHATDWAAQMRGGLHYMRLTCDPSGTVDESVESNNSVVLAYRWEPVVLASDAPQTLTRGPKMYPIGASSVALDGFGNGGWGGWWDVTGAMPSGSADYDVYLYTADPTPTTGWTTTVAASGAVSAVDFVGSNNNAVGDADFVGIINYTDSAEDYTVEREASTGIGSPPTPPALVGNYSIAGGEILDVYEMYAPDTNPVWFNFDVTDGTADLVICVFGPSSTYFARSGATWTLNGGGAGADETGIFTPGAAGWHGIVVCKNLRTDLANFANYSFYWGAPAGDLTHYNPAGWTAPVVARNGGVVGVLPANLTEGASVADAGLTNIGAGTMAAGSNLAFYLDGLFAYSSGDFSALAPAATGTISNRSIGAVKGGRHELGSVLDYLSEIGEQPPLGESNNGSFTQYCWNANVLANGTPLSRSAAPSWANFNNPNYWAQAGYNQDGYQYSTSYWTGVASIPADASMQLDETSFDNATVNSTTGFTGELSLDYNAPGRITLTMANGNVLGNGQVRTVGVLNNWAYPSVTPVGNYTVNFAQRYTDLFLGSVLSNTLTGSATTGGQILHTYDVYLYAGTTYPLTLFNNSTVDLGVAVFSAGLDYVPKNAALADFDAPGSGVDEVGSFTPSTTGWHGVAVYRSGSADLGPAAPYGIVIGTWAPAAVLDLDIFMTDTDGTDLFLALDLQWPDVTTDINGNPLTVDHYNTYWSFDAYSNWNLISSPVVSEELGLSAYIGIQEDLYFMVTAVDENGSLLGGSQTFHGILGTVPTLPGRPAGPAPLTEDAGR